MQMLILLLASIGAINWGLVGLGSFLDTNLNLVNLLLGSWPVVENIVYLVVGICGIVLLIAHLQKKCTMCASCK
ncbi:DUF378 domain-containing protein [Candidatus Peregrinibacteria bacterium]|nr:DUF378 domain-containing protein [Candidatus Peregrinibacteria bacterium]